MKINAPLSEIEIHWVPSQWAEERGERYAKAAGAGAMLVLSDELNIRSQRSQVILFPHSEDIPNDGAFNTINVTDGDITWQ